MESSTARCPQCGAAIRPSARFCVTCGIKLPETTPASGGTTASGWSAREEPVSQDTDPVWAMPAPQPASVAEPATTGDAADGDESQDADSGSSQPPAAGSWLHWPEPSSETGAPAESPDEPEIQGEIVEMVGETPEGENQSVKGESTTDSAAVETTEAPVDAVIAEEDAIEVAALDAAGSEPIAAPPTSYELPVPDDEPEPDSGNASPLDEAAQEELNPYDDFIPEEWQTSAEPEEIIPEAIEIDLLDDESPSEESGDMTAEEAGTPMATSTSSSLDRANALIDDLRALLPALVAPAPAAEEPRDLAAIRDRAVAARGEMSFDRFQALREVVQEALTRPRDVEVVLRLSRRVEDMDALLAEWDRLQQAFDQIVAELE